MPQPFLFLRSFDANEFNRFANKELLPLMRGVKFDSAVFESLEHIRPYNYSDRDGFYDTSHCICVTFRAKSDTSDKFSTYIFEISLKNSFQDLPFKYTYFERVHLLDSSYHPIDISFNTEEDIIELIRDFLTIEDRNSYLSKKSAAIESQNRQWQGEQWMADNIIIRDNDTSCGRCQEDPCCCSDPDPG